MKRHPSLVPLSRQHHDGLALGVFIKRGLRDGAGPAAAEALRKQALDLWDLELRGHFEVEESVLFPAVRSAIPAPELVDRLVREHREIQAGIEALRTAPAEGLPELLRQLGATLVAHIRSEERVLFEAVQQSLDESALARIGGRIEETLPAVCVNLGSADVPTRR